MSTHTLTIQNHPYPCFDKIASGEKTVEGRLYDGRYKSFKVGDIIIFDLKGKQVKTKITYIHKYKNLGDYLIKETLAKTLPGVTSIEIAIEIYNTWSTLKKRHELYNKTGYSFLGIGIKLI